MSESFLDGRVQLLRGDCLELLPTLEESSVDSIVTDPPYLLEFMGKKWDGTEKPPLDSGLGNWLAGFADGEGCFTTRKNGKGYVCEFIIHVRADDAKILREVHRATGIGDIRGPSDRGDGGAPMIKWLVSRQADCAKLVQIFQAFPLRAKKARDFEIWASAVEEWIAHEPGTSWADLASHAELLSSVKAYGSSFHPSQLFHYRWTKLAYRALKPGGHLIAFGGTRTFHRLAAAIEDAGFEIRDQIGWCYGSGFPKSHDISKAIDRAAGAARGVVSVNGNWRSSKSDIACPQGDKQAVITAPATDSAIQWQGWGTALKPAWEPIVLARKPLSESSIASNVLKHGTGAINVDGCRIEAGERPHIERRNDKSLDGDVYGSGINGSRSLGTFSQGRWPANLIHDGSEEVVRGFPESAGQQGDLVGHSRDRKSKGIYGDFPAARDAIARGDSGSAARFFYTAKADADDRLGSKHPTVKPLDLIQYLARLITPRGGCVLDPFAGTGTCGEAAWREGFSAILIEREPEYQADIVKRMGLCLAGPDERRAASVKQLPIDDLPMFGGSL